MQALRIERLRRTTRGKIPAPRSLTHEEWPPDYDLVHAWRARQLEMMELNPDMQASAIRYYSTRPVDYINHWGNTFDPRHAGTDRPTVFPMILFTKQEELIEFVLACLEAEAGGQIEKSRDMGATWVGAHLSVWMWRFWGGTAIGWGSNKKEKVDVLDDPDSVMEKIRMAIRWMPDFLKPPGFSDDCLKQYLCLNPDNGSTIRGEIGKSIGRGGRTRVYFVDEAAHLDKPEAVTASLSENTRCRIDISSVSGLGTIFHRSRESGVEWKKGEEADRRRSNVFVMDWRHHPEKTEEWFKEREARFTNMGLRHVFAREVERNYSASVEGVIIPYEWLESCVDAHKKIDGFDEDGLWVGGLDIADAGLDTNALVRRQGWIYRKAEEWGERDPGRTARRALRICRGTRPITLEYDCIGIGSNVKSEANRLKDDDEFPEGITLVPWNAGAAVLNPSERVVPDDPESLTNKQFFANFKAQAWWTLRRRVYQTHLTVTGEGSYPAEDLVSFDSKSLGDIMLKLLKELAQAVAGQSSRMQTLVEKTPEGTKSPNLGDAAVMASCPWEPHDRTPSQFFAPVIVS